MKGRTLLVALIAIYAITVSGSDSQFEVARGKTVKEITYTASGDLLYKGKPFKPAVTGTKDMPAFLVTIASGRPLAAAIGKDVDGQDTLYLLKLDVITAISFQSGGTKWVAARQTFWSPSGRYLLALCAYEGQRFLRADIRTGEIVEGPWLSPADAKLTWAVDSDPKWDGSTDVLHFIVNESCDPYEDACGPDARDAGKVLAKRNVALDAETLALRVK